MKLIIELTESELAKLEEATKTSFYGSDIDADVSDAVSKLIASSAPKKVGKWIYDGDCIICNKCLKAFGWISMNMTSNFCPDCGSYNGGGEADD